MKDATVVVPFTVGRRKLKAREHVETYSRGIGADARCVDSRERSVRYFRDIHGSESIGHPDGVRVGGERCASGDHDVSWRHRFVVCAYRGGARAR